MEWVAVNQGWWTVGRFQSAPIRVHWSLPLAAFVWGRFAFAPAFWLGFVLLILIHELGHALMVTHYRLGLSEIALHGAGGHCEHLRSGTRFQAAAVAWGGVLAQLAVLLLAWIILAAASPLTSEHAAALASVFTTTNLWLIVINLLPVAGLDGEKAWPIVGMLRARLRNRTAARDAFAKRQSVADELRALERLDTNAETPSQRTERLVRELIERTTQPKDR